MSDQLSFDDVVADRQPPTTTFTVEVIRSARRRKTSQGRLRGDVLEIRIPSWFSPEQEEETVAHFRRRFERATTARTIDLTARARVLAAQLDLPEPSQIRWVSNQRDRWGSCTPAHRTIRLSDRLAGFPPWVVDYVIVHEMAHLVEANHGEQFWALVERYRLSERARGYLLAKGHDGC